jgi:ABC-type multidrug transport system fused ATPase/permease subunit
MVVESGNIVEKGTPSELLAQDGHYKQLYETQISHK